MDNERIMYDSPEAACKVTVEVWESRGVIFKDEQTARYHGCTHRKCQQCDKPTNKYYTLCESCREKKAIERWEALPEVEWDGRTPLALHDGGRYFWTEDDLNDYCADNAITRGEAMLVICRPVVPPNFDSSFLADYLPEDADCPREIEEAIENLNRVIAAAGPLSWTPGNTRPKFKA